VRCPLNSPFDQSPREEYAKYAAQIRDEYEPYYSKEDYRTGRTVVLEHLKGRDGIYLTEYWRAQRQDAALANMEWELEQLLQKASNSA
jgi:predicted metal-dependent HD superfamily phosphohydrolase